MSDSTKEWEGWVQKNFTVRGATREEALENLVTMLRENLTVNECDVCEMDD